MAPGRTGRAVPSSFFDIFQALEANMLRISKAWKTRSKTRSLTVNDLQIHLCPFAIGRRPGRGRLEQARALRKLRRTRTYDLSGGGAPELQR